MEVRVAELSRLTGVAVDTIRFYQARGLIGPPLRRGRFAIYGPDHLARLRRIRRLLESGFSLAQIRRLLDADAPDETPLETPDAALEAPASLLASLAVRSVGEGTLTPAELASESGIPEALVAAVVRAGLLVPIEIQGERRFARSDLDLLRAALELLGEGLPLDRLLELAKQHVESTALLAERAIDLFDDHVRKPHGEDEDAVRRAFERLLPQATQVVALHFQRTLVARALARLREKGDEHALERTLEAAESRRLEVQWR